jgi:hypothetical protein
MQPALPARDLGSRLQEFCDRYVEADSFYAKLRQWGELIAPEEDFQGVYCPDKGRPGIAGSLKMKVLLLAYHDGASDREAERRSRLDLGWKYGLNVPWDWPGLDHSTMVVFRANVLLDERYRAPFDRGIRKAVEAGLLPPEALQVIDSSPMRGAAQVQDTYELLRTSTQKAVRKVREKSPQVYEKLQRQGLDGYERQEGKAKIDWQDEHEKLRHLRQLVRDGQQVAEVIRESGLEEEELEQATRMFEAIVRQDTEGEGEQRKIKE